MALLMTQSAAYTAARQAIAEAIGQYPDDGMLLIAAKCRGLLAGYDALYRYAPFVPVEIEQTKLSCLVNPVTGAKSRTFQVGGKLDVVGWKDKKWWLVDHKTTSADISDPAGPYFRQLSVEGQVNHYMLLAWLLGERYEGATWDIVRKPMISPKKLSKAERGSAVGMREYCGRGLSTATLSDLQTDDRETLEMYEYRLARDCTVERPEWYFARHDVPRLDAEIEGYAMDLWQHGKDILHTRQAAKDSGRLPPPSPKACMAYGSPCTFLGICSGYDTPDSNNWRPRQCVHAELPELEGDGRNLLTHSRLTTWLECKRKHHFRYDVGIERVRDKESEALLFGHVWHAALEAWNLAIIAESKGEQETDKQPAETCYDALPF